MNAPSRLSLLPLRAQSPARGSRPRTHAARGRAPTQLAAAQHRSDLPCWDHRAPTTREVLMLGDSWERYAPLTGVVFVVIVVIAFLWGGSTPDPHDSTIKVAAFYTKHRDQQTAVAFVLAIGAAFLPFFASSLKRALDWSGGTSRLSNAAFGGAIVATVGFFILSTVHVALADSAGKTPPLVTQTLNVLDGNDFIPAAAGMGVFMIASGLAILRYRALAAGLGW